jgi:branched-chain amino acid transport system ATP-binding protein
MSLALEIRDLCAGYGPMQVIHNIDLAVEPDERVGLLGLNGHGKTTLLRSVLGLVDWRRGDVRLHGQSMLKAAPHQVARRGVVLVPQGDALFPGLSVRDNLDSGAYMAKSWRGRNERRARILEVFPQLSSRLDQAAGTLSGGERRMVAIGRGLMAKGDIYLVDEPSLGLAPGIASSMIDALLSLDLAGGGLVLAEQNHALFASRIDRTVHLHGGRVVSGSEAAGDPIAGHAIQSESSESR